MALVLLKNNKVISVTKIEHCLEFIDDVLGRDFTNTLQDFIEEERMNSYCRGYDELAKENDELSSIVDRLLDVNRAYKIKYENLKRQVGKNNGKN